MYLGKTVDYNVEEYVECYGLNVKTNIEIGIDHRKLSNDNNLPHNIMNIKLTFALTT